MQPFCTKLCSIAKTEVQSELLEEGEGEGKLGRRRGEGGKWKGGMEGKEGKERKEGKEGRKGRKGREGEAGREGRGVLKPPPSSGTSRGNGQGEDKLGKRRGERGGREGRKVGRRRCETGGMKGRNG